MMAEVVVEELSVTMGLSQMKRKWRKEKRCDSSKEGGIVSSMKKSYGI